VTKCGQTFSIGEEKMPKVAYYRCAICESQIISRTTDGKLKNGRFLFQREEAKWLSPRRVPEVRVEELKDGGICCLCLRKPEIETAIRKGLIALA